MANDRNIDIEQAKVEIEELKKQIADVNDEKIEFERELVDIDNSYKKKISDLQKKHDKTVKTINSETEKLKRDLLELDDKTKNLSTSYRKRMDEVEAQIADIKNNKFNVFNKDLNQQKEKYQKTKIELNEELETLLAKKNLYVERYNAQIVELDEKYKNLKQKEEDNKNALIQENENIVLENEEALKNLENEKNALIENHKLKLEKIKANNEQILNDIKSKEESIYQTLLNQKLSFDNQLKSLIAQRDAKAVEVEEENNKLSLELENTKIKNQEIIDKAKAENDVLRSEIEQKEAELKEVAELHTANYKKKKEEYEEYVEKLGKNEEKLASDLLAKLNKKDDKFKERFSSLIEGIDKTFEVETKRYNQEIDALAYKLSIEKSNYEKLYKLSEERFAEKKKEYENVVNVLKDENQVLIEEADSLLTEYNNRISKFRLDIIKLQEKHKNEVELLAANYDQEIQTVSDELSAKEDEIRKEIAYTNSSIKIYEDNIARLNEEYPKFVQKIEEAKAEENKKHNAFLAELQNKQNDLHNTIAAIEKEIHLINTNKVDEMNSFYQGEKDRALASYREKIAGIKKAHEEELEKCNQNFSDECQQVRIDYENKVKNLIEETNKSKEVIEEQIDKLKEDYENHKEKLEELANKLASDKAEQVEYYNNQRENIHQQIEDAKNTYLAEKEEFNVKLAAIDAEHELTLEKMKQEQDEKIKELVRTMETIPTEELFNVKARFETIMNEDAEATIMAEREKIQNELEEFKKSQEVIREEAQAIYNDVEKTLEVKQQEEEAASNNLNANLNLKQQEIDDFNSKLEQDVADIQAANAAESENLAIQLEEQLLETKNAFDSKYAVVENQYNQEINALKDELNRKKDEYSLLISETDNKKLLLENEYKAKCDEEAAKTRTVQEELNRVLKANADQRAEWNRILNLRADQIADEDRILVEKYDKAIQEKRAVYQKCLDAIRNDITTIKTEIANNEAAKLEKQNAFDVFKMEKKMEMDQIRATTDEMIDNLTEKSKIIVEQTAALEKVHAQKIDFYKNRVAELMAQLKELEKVRPSIIRKAVEEGSDSLVRKTEEFKNKIQLLEKTNKEILEKLELRRNQTVEKIKFELSELISGKTTIIKSHEEDLDRIVRAYEALLRDEAYKQASLNEQLIQEKERIAQEEAKYLQDKQNNEVEWAIRVKTLSKVHEENEQNLINEMNPQIKEFSKELLNSKEYNNDILKDIEELKAENEKFNKQIIEDKNSLVEEYINKLEDINVLFNKNKEEEKERLKGVDVLSDDILELFKKK